MSEKPILFSAPMVRALLDGRKTQTRRLVKPQPQHGVGRYTDGSAGVVDWVLLDEDGDPIDSALRCPYGVPGDILWVRETHHQCPHCPTGQVSYRAGGWTRLPSGAPDDGGDHDDLDTRPLPPKCTAHGWIPSIHMRRSYCRLTLEVTEVRIERVQDISEADAIAEGISCTNDHRWGLPETGMEHNAPKHAFRHLWEQINGAKAWDCNPWVWVVEFRKVNR